jgi:Heavy metal associated domain 2
VKEEAEAGPAREPLELVHHHPGRLRLRSEAFRGAVAVDEVRSALEIPGITRVSHSDRTGSLLIEYQPGLADAEVIIAAIVAAAGLDPPAEDVNAARRREPAVAAVDAARELNEIVYELTGYRAELRTLVPIGLSALAAYSFVYHKDARLPRWDNLLYWSYNIFSQLHRREIDQPRPDEAPGGKPRAPDGAEAPGKPKTDPRP